MIIPIKIDFFLSLVCFTFSVFVRIGCHIFKSIFSHILFPLLSANQVFPFPSLRYVDQSTLCLSETPFHFAIFFYFVTLFFSPTSRLAIFVMFEVIYETFLSFYHPLNLLHLGFLPTIMIDCFMMKYVCTTSSICDSVCPTKKYDNPKREKQTKQFGEQKKHCKSR